MKKEKIGSILIILIVLALTVFFALQLKDLRISGDFTALLPWNEMTDYYIGGVENQEAILAEKKEEEVYITTEYRTGMIASSGLENGEREKDYPYTSTLYILVSSDNLYTPSFLNELSNCIDTIDNRRDCARPSSVLDWFTLTGEGDYIDINQMSPLEKGEKWNEKSAKELERRIKNDPIVPYFLVGGSGNSFMLEFLYADNYDSSQMDSIASVFSALEEMGGRVILMSNMVVSYEVVNALKRDLTLLASLALLVLLGVYYFSFRSIRAVIIPSFLSVVSLIWTLGGMALLNMELNLLNILTPCMVLILGSTYSIHVLNEYYREVARGGEFSVIKSTKRVLMTVFLGCITTILGFLSLSIAPSGTLKNFGLSVSMGVAISALMALICLPSILIILPYPKRKNAERLNRGWLQKAVEWWSRKVYLLYPILVIIFLLIVVLFFAVKDKVSIDSNYMSYFSEKDPFGQDCRFFFKEIGGTTPFTVTITAPEGEENFFLDIENLRAVREWEEHMLANDNVLQIISLPSYIAFANRELVGEYEIPRDEGLGSILTSLIMLYGQSIEGISQVISNKNNTLTITVQTWDASKEDIATSSSIRNVYSDMVAAFALLPEGTKASISGYPIISEKYSSRLLSDQSVSTSISIFLIFIVASLFLLSPIKGVEVLVPVLSGIMLNYIFMYLAHIPFDMVTVSFSNIAVGCGVDDALHFTLNYNAYKKAHPSSECKEVVRETISKTGRPIILTTLSIVLSMAMLSFGTYTPIKYFGLLMVVTLLSCMISTLVFLPTSIYFFDTIKSFFDGRAFVKGDRKRK